jgi:hypothetical protein
MKEQLDKQADKEEITLSRETGHNGKCCDKKWHGDLKATHRDKVVLTVFVVNLEVVYIEHGLQLTHESLEVRRSWNQNSTYLVLECNLQGN